MDEDDVSATGFGFVDELLETHMGRLGVCSQPGRLRSKAVGDVLWLKHPVVCFERGLAPAQMLVIAPRIAAMRCSLTFETGRVATR